MGVLYTTEFRSLSECFVHLTIYFLLLVFGIHNCKGSRCIVALKVTGALPFFAIQVRAQERKAPCLSSEVLIFS